MHNSDWEKGKKELTAATLQPPMLVYNRSKKKIGKETTEKGNQMKKVKKKVKPYNK